LGFYEEEFSIDMENLNYLFKQLAEPGIFAAAGIIIFVILLSTIYFFIKGLIKKRNEAYDRIRMMANIDDLTQLFNRKYFDTLFEKELARAIRYERNLNCAMLEIDNFKTIRDKYGHQLSDKVLQDIAEIFTDETRINDICARYNGDRFISLLPETEIESALFVCKRLRGLVEGNKFNFGENNETIPITVSIGITSCKAYLDEGVDVHRIISMANKALDIAKERGGNRVECFIRNNS